MSHEARLSDLGIQLPGPFAPHQPLVGCALFNGVARTSGALLRANVWFNRARKALKMPYWSLSAYLKHRVKNVVQFVCDFEEAVAHAARERGVDGVVCGHIHCAEIRRIGSIEYMNDGDWVESCTALVEHENGEMQILRWTEEIAERTIIHQRKAA